MKFYLLPLITAFMFFSCRTIPHASDQLVKMELNRSKAIEFHDSIALQNMYADDFSGVAAGGLVVNKPILMEVFKRHGDDLIFVNDDHKVRFTGRKTAVLTGRLTAKNRDNQVVGVSRYSHVLVWRDGRWQIVYGQGTVIPVN